MLAIAGPAHSVTRAAAMPAVIFFLPISQVQPGCAGRATAIEVLDKPAGAQGKRAPYLRGRARRFSTLLMFWRLVPTCRAYSLGVSPSDWRCSFTR